MPVYDDLAVEILSRTEDGYAVRVRALGVSESGRLVLPPELDPAHTAPGVETGLGHGALRSATRDILEHSVEPQTAEIIGAQLFRALFSGPVGDFFNTTLGKVEERKHVLRIRLHMDLDDPTVAPLAALPWELLHQHGTRQSVALAEHMTIVRYLDVPRAKETDAFVSPLQVLLVIANPHGDLDLTRERNAIEAALRRADAKVRRLENPTYGEFCEDLDEHDYDIIHYMGHGSVAGENGLLHFPDRAVTGKELGLKIQAEPQTRLVVLNACRTAASGTVRTSDPYAGVAAALIMQGVPVVIAMQLPIADHTASIFAEKFYSKLASGEPVEEAVRQGRIAIYASNEWSTPVLFARRDGDLFREARPSRENGDLRSAVVRYLPRAAVVLATALGAAAMSIALAFRDRDDRVAWLALIPAVTAPAAILYSSRSARTHDPGHIGMAWLAVFALFSTLFLLLGAVVNPNWRPLFEPKVFTIHGCIARASDDSGVEGVEVSVLEAVGSDVVTDGNGEFTIELQRSITGFSRGNLVDLYVDRGTVGPGQVQLFPASIWVDTLRSDTDTLDRRLAMYALVAFNDRDPSALEKAPWMPCARS